MARKRISRGHQKTLRGGTSRAISIASSSDRGRDMKIDSVNDSKLAFDQDPVRGRKPQVAHRTAQGKILEIFILKQNH